MSPAVKEMITDRYVARHRADERRQDNPRHSQLVRDLIGRIAELEQENGALEMYVLELEQEIRQAGARKRLLLLKLADATRGANSESVGSDASAAAGCSRRPPAFTGDLP